MNPSNIPFQLTDWNIISATEHEGITGSAFWKTLQFGDLRIRMVEYSKDYCADHWCSKGHFILVLEGSLIIEHKDNSVLFLKKDMSYFVGDNSMEHLAKTTEGAKVLIVD